MFIFLWKKVTSTKSMKWLHSFGWWKQPNWPKNQRKKPSGLGVLYASHSWQISAFNDSVLEITPRLSSFLFSAIVFSLFSWKITLPISFPQYKSSSWNRCEQSYILFQLRSQSILIESFVHTKSGAFS